MRKEYIDNMRVLGWDMKTFGICNDSYMFSKCIKNVNVEIYCPSPDYDTYNVYCRLRSKLDTDRQLKVEISKNVSLQYVERFVPYIVENYLDKLRAVNSIWEGKR